MKPLHLQIFMLFIGATLLCTDVSYGSSTNCIKEKAEFKKLYLELQAKFLNYEGKDTIIDSKGNLSLVAHDPKKTYEGKMFEEAIFKEYQNSLKKVGKLFQNSRFANNNDDLKKSTPGLVEFLKAIEATDNSTYLVQNNISKVIDDLHQASQLLFGDPDNKKFALNENDKYLLKKLLTHAQDRVCSVEAFEKNGKATKHFDTKTLAQIKNAPLNRLIGAIKNANIGADSDLLVDDNTAISSAMSEHMNQLAKWMKDNERCRKAVANPAFLQANIQVCNYNKFLDSLNQQNFDQLQAVLHFINSNETFLNGRSAKAETALDELKLESYIDSAFTNLENKVSCSKINGPQGKKRLFVRNIPFKNNKFDTSKIICKEKEKELKPDDCEKRIEFVSDELGRGLEVRQKGVPLQSLTISIVDSPECTNLNTDVGPVVRLIKTTEDCALEGEKMDQQTLLIPSEDKKSCIPAPKTPAVCIEEGNNLNPKKILIPSDDKKSCVEAIKKQEEDEKAEAKTEREEEKEEELKTAELCKSEGDAKNPKVQMIPSEDKKSCIEAPKKQEEKPEELKTADICKSEGEAKNPKIDMIPSEDKKSCVVVPKKAEDGEALCQKKNDQWSAENDGRPTLRWKWDAEKKNCIDSKPPKVDSQTKSEKEAPPESSSVLEEPKQAPTRFVPVNIPTRQIYILPGMP